MFLSVSPHSDAVGRAYFAAMDDVLKMGAQPVPLHLRNAGDRRMKHHGIGIGYLNPHEFEGDDVAQQYLPEALAGRRYYHPSDQGYEITIAARMEARAEARREKPRRKTIRYGADSMAVAGAATRAASEARAKVAKTQRDDAG